MQPDRRTFLLGAAASLVPARAIAQSPPAGTINLMSYGGIFQDNYVCLLYTSPSPRDS